MNKTNKNDSIRESVDSKKTNSDNSSTLWYHDIEGSGQRKRYLRSLKEEVTP